MHCEKCGKMSGLILLALGILSAGSIFLMGITSTFTGYGETLIYLIRSIYIGYSASIIGSFIGAIWAFIDGFICGSVLAWLYNKFI